jgi:hypothetical protein
VALLLIRYADQLVNLSYSTWWNMPVLSFEQVLGFIAIVLVSRFLLDARKNRKLTQNGDVTVFPPVLFFRILFGFIVPILLYGSVVCLLEHQWLAFGAGLVLWVFMVWQWQGTLFLDKNSIREVRWLGLKRTTIPWSDVVFAGGDFDNGMTIRSKDDHVISYTLYHGDREDFIGALKQYCPLWSPEALAKLPVQKPWVPLGGSRTPRQY